MSTNSEFQKRTGGFIAPVAEMVYGENGQCVATFPHGGLTVLDQFALGLAGDLVVFHGSISSPEWVANHAYELAAAMLAKKRQIEGT